MSMKKWEGQYIFNSTDLNELAAKYRDQYADASPFPHVVIDNFLPEDILSVVLDEFPRPGQIEWIEYDGWEQKKLASKKEEEIGPVTKFLLYQFNSGIFVNFLQSLTGIEGLIPDPHFWGGGLHQIGPNGHLKLHADFSLHPILNLDRRINILIYLNKKWEDKFGGHLELWDRDITKCEARILPIFNRCVIFNTTHFSIHGHPEPLTCPEDRTRKSLALYYYSNGRPVDETSRTLETHWKMTPAERDGRRLKTAIKRFIPPIFLDLKQTVTDVIKGKSA